ARPDNASTIVEPLRQKDNPVRRSLGPIANVQPPCDTAENPSQLVNAIHFLRPAQSVNGDSHFFPSPHRRPGAIAAHPAAWGRHSLIWSEMKIGILRIDAEYAHKYFSQQA
ncbi:MAG: hypothetical protein ACYS5V_11915, partial [Planctomycetota bacterium]